MTARRIRSCKRCREPVFSAIRLDGIRVAIDANPVQVAQGLGLVRTDSGTVAVPVEATQFSDGWVYSQHECKRRPRAGRAALRRIK